MLDVTGLIVQLVSGLAGAHLVIRLIERLSLGRLGNAIAGMAGGVVGGQMMATVLDAGARVPIPASDVGSVVSQIAAAGVGGGLMTMAVALVRRCGTRR